MTLKEMKNELETKAEKEKWLNEVIEARNELKLAKLGLQSEQS